MHDSLAHFGFTALLVLAGGACASTADRTMLSGQAQVLDVPLIEPERASNACGLGSVTALCAYWGVPIPESERVRLTALASHTEGLSGDELRDALDGLGFETYIFHGQLDHSETGLFTHIDARRPALVMLTPEANRRHYVLFIGYDEVEANACLLDPVRGRILMPYATFETSWGSCEHFTLLAIPKATQPTTNGKEETSS